MNHATRNRIWLPALVSLLFLSLLGVLGCAQQGGPAGDEDAEATEAGAPEAPSPDAGSAPAAPAPSAPARSAPAPSAPAPKPAAPAAGESATADSGPQVPSGLVALPAGEELTINLLTPLSTKDTTPGTPFEARIRGGRWVGDKKLKMSEWTFLGTVGAVNKPTKKGDKPGSLELEFHTIRTETGAEYTALGFASDFAGETKNRNIGVVAGAAVLGAVVGNKAGDGGTTDTLIGAAAGAAAGAGIVRALPGKHLNLPEGAEMIVTLVEDAYLPYAKER